MHLTRPALFALALASVMHAPAPSSAQSFDFEQSAAVFQAPDIPREMPEIDLTRMDRPSTSAEEIARWAASAVSQVMSFSGGNWQAHLPEVSRKFTRDGWESFAEAALESGLVRNYERYGITAEARAEGPARLVGAEARGGIWHWQIEVPVEMRYRTATNQWAESQLVRLTIRREDPKILPRGFGIARWVADLR